MNIIVILLTVFSLNSIIKRTAIVTVLQSVSVKYETVTRIKVKMLISWKERQCASSVRLRRTYNIHSFLFFQQLHC